MVSSHEIREFEFHISPMWSPSRPHTYVGRAPASAEDLTSPMLVVAHALWAGNRFRNVSNDAVEPAPHLVAEDAEPTEAVVPDRALNGRSARRAIVVRDGHAFSMTPSGTVTSNAVW